MSAPEQTNLQQTVQSMLDRSGLDNPRLRFIADMTTELQRTAFERWLRTKWTPGYAFPREPDGRYHHGEVARFWECWQAALAPAEPKPEAPTDIQRLIAVTKPTHGLPDAPSVEWSMRMAQLEPDSGAVDAGPAAPPEQPALPEWSKRDDLGGLVPSEIRTELRAYGAACVAADRANRKPCHCREYQPKDDLPDDYEV